MSLKKSKARLLKAKPHNLVEKPRRLKTLVDLAEVGLLPESVQNQSAYQELSATYDISITPHVAHLIEKPMDPVGLQYVPQLEELFTTPWERADPIGDGAHSPVKGIVHRYPDRVLLKVTQICAVYCRYCFRREMIGPQSEGLAAAELEEALAYIAAHPEVWEVILTGGDPLVLSARRLQDLVERLCAIEHVRIIRIHTRVPVASPESINDTILSVLQNAQKPIYMVLHVNHPKEISEDVQKTVKKLHFSGCNLLSQSVLLKGVNDDAYTLESLFKLLLTLHIKPYYLHHPDLAKGTSHFRVSIKKGQQIMRQLRGRISGLAMPTYVLDIPGGFGKIPVEQTYIQEQRDAFRLEDFRGSYHEYADCVRDED